MEFLLHLVILIPIVSAAAVLLGAPARKTSLSAAGTTLTLVLIALLNYDRAAAGFQFQSAMQIVPEWDLKYFLGVDGLSLTMLLLTALVTLCAVWVAPADKKFERGYYASLLFISAGALGAFASLDLFFFYSFHELALIPTFLLIGIWGTGDRQKAAWTITIYLALGSFVLLLGLVGLYLSVPAGQRTFDIPALLEAKHAIDSSTQSWVYLLLLLGFGVLISLFPFHTWAPRAYASAPTPAAMLHAGVLKKFGLYGLLRIALPLLPQGAQHWTNLLLVLLIGNILYVGLVTIAQKKLDMMLGYSSVMHMGYVFLGVASLNIVGLSGAALLMLAHGLSIAALFALSGEVRQRTGSLEFSDLGGLGKTTPFLAAVFGFAAFASIGLPGFANFASEVMIFFGAFKTGFETTGFGWYQWTTVCAVWGVVISAVYMLRAYRTIFMGEPRKRWSELPDLALRHRLSVLFLLAALMVVGFYPRLLLDIITPSLR